MPERQGRARCAGLMGFGLWALARPLDLALGKMGAMGQFRPEE